MMKNELKQFDNKSKRDINIEVAHKLGHEHLGFHTKLGQSYIKIKTAKRDYGTLTFGGMMESVDYCNNATDYMKLAFDNGLSVVFDKQEKSLWVSEKPNGAPLSQVYSMSAEHIGQAVCEAYLLL